MTVITTFKRHELKYLLTKQQSKQLKDKMAEYTVLDQYAKHTIHTVYFDTDDYLLIRRSIEKPEYKEKLRIRSYGNTQENSDVFVEVKKKYKGVVYKRRVDLPLEEVYEYLFEEHPFHNETQITKEIDYFVHHYDTLAPRVLLSYDREAYLGIEDSEFRITFDQNIRVQDHDVCFMKEEEGILILPEGKVVLEVKTAMGMPQWILDFFSEQGIYKTTFSKYGTAYKNVILPKLLGGKTNVA